MDLSRNVIKRYVQVATPEKITSNSETVYGTVVSEGEELFVMIDGSSILTPVSSTIDIKANDRVLVLVKNHEATVIGSPSSPTARLEELKKLDGKITEFDTVIADKVGTGELVAIRASIDDLQATDAEITGKLTANEASIENLTAENTTINGKLTAYQADIEELQADKIDASEVEAKYATIENLTAANAKITNLETTKIDATTVETTYATIENLEATNAKFTNLNAQYANIDFANIGEAAFKKIFSETGIIKDIVVSGGTVTGELVGVTIKGDIIEGGTVKADKLVILGEDGLYYKLNVNSLGETTAASDPKYQNGLDGSAIIAKSITAEKVSVNDLVAFGATIGGFTITNNAIHSITKDSPENTTRGLYLDNEGQIAVGDDKNYLKFYKKDETNYVFEISLIDAVQDAININAEDISSLPTKDDIDDLKNQIDGCNEQISGLTDMASGLESDITANAEAVNDLKSQVDGTETEIGKLNASISKLLGPGKYIREGIVVNGDGSSHPCLELGELDSDYKVRLTNTELQFIDGESIPASISNQKLIIENAEVKDGLRFGGFVWKARENGNMGLTWNGGDN